MSRPLNCCLEYKKMGTLGRTCDNSSPTEMTIPKCWRVSRRHLLGSQEKTAKRCHNVAVNFCSFLVKQRAACDVYSAEQAIMPTILLLLGVLGYKVVLAVAEEYAWDGTRVVPESDNSMADGVMIAVFSLFCAIFMALLGSALGYFSAMEDRLMRRYRSEGVVVKAVVLSADLAPQTVQLHLPKKEQDMEEYVAIIDYECMDLGREASGTVRKQVKALGSDFSMLECSLMPREHVQLVIPDDLSIPGVKEKPSYSTSLELQVLVLPQHKNSGIPKNLVDRACSLRYRLPTVLVVLSVFAFSSACLWLSLTFIPDWIDEDIPIILYTILSTLALMVLALVATHFGLRDSIESALHDEYLRGGDALLSPADSSDEEDGDEPYHLLQ